MSVHDYALYITLTYHDEVFHSLFDYVQMAFEHDQTFLRQRKELVEGHHGRSVQVRLATFTDLFEDREASGGRNMRLILCLN